MMVISVVFTDTRAIDELARLVGGSTIGLNAGIAGSISGASMDLARTIGPALSDNTYTSLWIYMIIAALHNCIKVEEEVEPITFIHPYGGSLQAIRPGKG
jgi:glycerol uptake facilitator-like aquaporin